MIISDTGYYTIGMETQDWESILDSDFFSINFDFQNRLINLKN